MLGVGGCDGPMELPADERLEGGVVVPEYWAGGGRGWIGFAGAELRWARGGGAAAKSMVSVCSMGAVGA